MREIISNIFKLRNILPILFIIPDFIKLISKEKMKEFILSVLRLFILTTIVPLAVTLTVIVWSLLGQPMIHSLFNTIYILWLDYYFSGFFLGISAWRFHLVLLIFFSFLSLPRKY